MAGIGQVHGEGKKQQNKRWLENTLMNDGKPSHEQRKPMRFKEKKKTPKKIAII